MGSKGSPSLYCRHQIPGRLEGLADQISKRDTKRRPTELAAEEDRVAERHGQDGEVVRPPRPVRAPKSRYKGAKHRWKEGQSAEESVLSAIADMPYAPRQVSTSDPGRLGQHSLSGEQGAYG